jgi:hypothetical protein
MIKDLKTGACEKKTFAEGSPIRAKLSGPFCGRRVNYSIFGSWQIEPEY